MRAAYDALPAAMKERIDEHGGGALAVALTHAGGLSGAD